MLMFRIELMNVHLKYGRSITRLVHEAKRELGTQLSTQSPSMAQYQWQCLLRRRCSSKCGKGPP